MFAGSLSTFTLTSLIQICYNDSRNGAIEFTRGKDIYGKIGFENGRIVYADYLGGQGVDAIKQMALLSQLDFKFNDRTILPDTNVNTDINFLLIDCSRYVDESTEYLEKIRNMFDRKYTVDRVGFYEYGHPYFKVPHLFHIKYLETYDENYFTIIYLDKNIHARIEVLFRKKILTDDLLMFMESKDVF